MKLHKEQPSVDIPEFIAEMAGTFAGYDSKKHLSIRILFV